MGVLGSPPRPLLGIRKGCEPLRTRAPAGTRVRGRALTGAVAERRGCVVVGQGAEELSLDTHQGGPGKGHVVADGWLGHALVCQPVLSCHLPENGLGCWGLPAQWPGL